MQVDDVIVSRCAVDVTARNDNVSGSCEVVQQNAVTPVQRAATTEVFAARLVASLNADVVLRLVELQHAAHVVIAMHRSQVAFQIVLPVRRVAAVRAVEALLQSERHRPTVELSSAGRAPASDVIDTR